MFAFWSLVAGAATECSRRVRCKKLQSERLFLLWSLVAGAAPAQGCRCKVPLQGAAVRLLLRFGACLPLPLQNATTAGWQCKVLLSEPCLRFGAGCRCKALLLPRCCLCFEAWLLVPLPRRCCESCLWFGAWLLVLPQGAAARCCCQRAVCALGLGCWCWWWCCCCRAAECRRRVPLQGAAFRVLFVLWSLVADAATGCRQRVPLQDVPARCLFWSLVAGAAARCRHRVRLSEWCLCFGT